MRSLTLIWVNKLGRTSKNENEGYLETASTGRHLGFSGTKGVGKNSRVPDRYF